MFVFERIELLFKRMPQLARAAYPKKVKLVEVGPRDGLQNEATFVDTESKIELIHKLAKAKMPVIECTSFMPPKVIPQLADSRLVSSRIIKEPSTKYIAFAPNVNAVKMAKEAKYDGISFMVTGCEETVKKNLNVTVPQLITNMKDVVKEAKASNMSTRAYIGFAMGSEYTANPAPKSINDIANQLIGMQVDEVVLQDNIAAGTLEKLDALLAELTIPKEKIGVHLHDTKYIGMDMLLLAMSKGISIIDCAVAGLGQCYYNKSMLGNMVTEDLLFALDCMGIEHGVDWKILLDAGDTICEKMTRENCTDAFDVDFEEELDDYKKKYQNLIKTL